MDHDILDKCTIYLTKHGSHAYGLNTPSSDLDVRGVFVAPPEYYFGFLNRVEQVEDRASDDRVVFEIRKFFKLAIECNPNVIELLFVDDADILKTTPAGERIREARLKFVSQKAKHTFSGYAIAQLKRIKTHYRWLMNPPSSKPTRAEFGLPERTVIPADQLKAAESMVKKRIESWNIEYEVLDDATKIQLQNHITDYMSEVAAAVSFEKANDVVAHAAGRIIGCDDNFLELLDRERLYQHRQNEWSQYQNWLATRNASRAALEAKFGYDTKHAMHLVRLMRMGVEIMTSGRIIVKRPDREELLAIRNGLWTYEQLVEWASAREKDLTDMYNKGTSPLPKEPPRKELDALCIDIVKNNLGI